MHLFEPVDSRKNGIKVRQNQVVLSKQDKAVINVTYMVQHDRQDS